MEIKKKFKLLCFMGLESNICRWLVSYLELIYLYFPQSFHQTVVVGKMVENKGKLILTEIFPSVQKHDI